MGSRVQAAEVCKDSHQNVKKHCQHCIHGNVYYILALEMRRRPVPKCLIGCFCSALLNKFDCSSEGHLFPLKYMAFWLLIKKKIIYWPDCVFSTFDSVSSHNGGGARISENCRRQKSHHTWKLVNILSTKRHGGEMRVYRCCLAPKWDN